MFWLRNKKTNFQLHTLSPRATNTFNKVAEAKGLKVCSYVEKYAEFKNQTLKKIGWYTKMLCAAELPRVGNFSN